MALVVKEAVHYKQVEISAVGQEHLPLTIISQDSSLLHLQIKVKTL